jgi:acyl-CoA thioesterase-2
MFATQLEQLLSLLDLERIEENLFRGVSPQNGRDRIFGGQVLAQGLVAAGRTAPLDREAHSLHGYFLRPGDPKLPILYEVDRIRDGRSFTTRRVRAIQRGEAILNMAVSYQRPDEGFEHQLESELPGEPAGEHYEEAIRREIARHGMTLEADDRRFDLPLEVRTVGGLHFAGAAVEAPRMQTWMRTRSPVGDDLRLHQCLLAYASDLTLLISAVKPHPVGMTTPGFRTASLDHAMWFHRPFRIDDWLLYLQDSPISARSRGFARGAFYTRKGELVASCAQEGVLRYRPPQPKPR